MMRTLRFHNPAMPTPPPSAPRRFTVIASTFFPCSECGSNMDVHRVIPESSGEVKSGLRVTNMCRACRAKPVPVEQPEPEQPRRVVFRTAGADPGPLAHWPRVCLTCGGGHDLQDVPATGAAASVVMCRFCRRDAGCPT